MRGYLTVYFSIFAGSGDMLTGGLETPCSLDFCRKRSTLSIKSLASLDHVRRELGLRPKRGWGSTLDPGQEGVWGREPSTGSGAEPQRCEPSRV